MIVELAEKRDDQLLEKYSKILFGESRSTMNFNGRIETLNEPPGLFAICQLLRRALNAEWQRFRSTFFGLPLVNYGSPSDIISSNARSSNYLPIPPSFLEIFRILPVDILVYILPGLDRRSIMNLRLACRNFNISINEIHYRVRRPIEHSQIFILPGGVIRVRSGDINIYFTHEEFLRNIRVRRFNVLVINHRGNFQAADFYISVLRVRRIELRIRDAIQADQVIELETLFHQIVANRDITSVTMIVRTHANNRDVQASLDAILAGSPRINQAFSPIAVLRA